ncbi:hypothetical protein I5M32_05570 [Pedobacter sp. SD-b]|uniref:Uncharacterized protein n=1 Tax=Pedobacter segetis TaxID=2793069 RepID=A0ABS1BHU7_9SPHI|nr:hypothetical protein [Pedobacter segetis]MBK0382425.1 hypothetical protein [Pedobacter segetis]
MGKQHKPKKEDFDDESLDSKPKKRILDEDDDDLDLPLDDMDDFGVDFDDDDDDY